MYVYIHVYIGCCVMWSCELGRGVLPYDALPVSTSQGIMLVYDVTNEKSFENIRNWIRNIEEVHVFFNHSHVPAPFLVSHLHPFFHH